MTPAGYPLGVHADANNDLIVVDSLRAAVVRWTGYRYEVIAGGNGVGSSANQLSSPLGAFFLSGSPDMLYVADTANHRIVAWPRGSVTGNVVFGTGTCGPRLLVVCCLSAAALYDSKLSDASCEPGSHKLSHLSVAWSPGLGRT
ncbi:KEA2 [Symbiodinium sp. CCMP2592]|nr:KEA2 [Symbiodinium sp. CCMP2592]